MSKWWCFGSFFCISSNTDRALLISLVVSLVYILLLRFTAGFLLWTTIITVLLLLAYGAYSQVFFYITTWTSSHFSSCGRICYNLSESVSTQLWVIKEIIGENLQIAFFKSFSECVYEFLQVCGTAPMSCSSSDTHQVLMLPLQKSACRQTYRSIYSSDRHGSYYVSLFSLISFWIISH